MATFPATTNSSTISSDGGHLHPHALVTDSAGNQVLAPAMSAMTATGDMEVVAMAKQLPSTVGPLTPSGSMSIVSGNPSLITSGRQVTTLSAVALQSNPLTNGVVITANLTNIGTIYVGPSGVTALNGYPLIAGQSMSYGITNTNAIYIVGTNTTDILSYTGN